MEIICFNEDDEEIYRFRVNDNNIIKRFKANCGKVRNIELRGTEKLQRLLTDLIVPKIYNEHENYKDFFPEIFDIYYEGIENYFRQITNYNYLDYISLIYDKYHSFSNQLLKTVMKKNNSNNVIINTSEAAYFASLCSLIQKIPYEKLDNIDYIKSLRKIPRLKAFEAIFYRDLDEVSESTMKVLNDFSDNFYPIEEGIVDEINQKVLNNTKGLIENFVNESDIDESTNIVILGTSYIDELWKNKFRDFEKDYFYEYKNRKVRTNFLVGKSYLIKANPNYKDGHLIQIPLSGDDYKIDGDGRNNFQFFIQMPNEFDKEVNYDSKLIKEFDDIYFGATPLIKIPEFSLDSEINLKEVLTEMNYPVNQSFENGKRINMIKQKAKLIISQKGFIAASATVMGLTKGVGGITSYDEIIINKPFYVWILFRDILIFSAYIKNPS